VLKQSGTRRGRRPVFSFVDRVRLLRAADFKCQCGCDDLESLQIDHIVPVWAGGSNDITNGQVLCVDCHTVKTSADVAAFQKSRDVRLVMEA
jgi:5-methylcytosine-specific restriction protein A